MENEQTSLIQKKLNEATYIDLCRAETRMKEFVDLGQKLLDSLPAHWHDEAITEFADLVQKTDCILRPVLYSEARVKKALEEYV